MTTWPERLLAVAAGTAGVLGVALAAAAAHVATGPTLDVAARFLLVHAGALLGLAAASASGIVSAGLGRFAGLVLALGLALFCGDLSLRAVRGHALFAAAAPAGGVLLMAGWALVATAAVWSRSSAGRG